MELEDLAGFKAVDEAHGLWLDAQGLLGLERSSIFLAGSLVILGSHIDSAAALSFEDHIFASLTPLQRPSRPAKLSAIGLKAPGVHRSTPMKLCFSKAKI